MVVESDRGGARYRDIGYMQSDVRRQERTLDKIDNARSVRVRVGASPIASALDTPKADWERELQSCGVMSNRFVAAISGDEAKVRALLKGLETLKADWGMNEADLRTFLSGGVVAAISGDEAKAAAFWKSLAKLKADWGMNKADLCKFMSDSVAAAMSGDEAKAAAFWRGLATLKIDCG